MRAGWLTVFAGYLLVLCGIIAAAYLGLIDSRRVYFPHWDALGHFVLIGLAGLLLDLAWRHRTTAVPLPLGDGWRVSSAGLVVAGAAALEELLQFFSSARSFDPLDLLADLTGIIAFIGAGRWAARRWGRPRRSPDSGGEGDDTTGALATH